MQPAQHQRRRSEASPRQEIDPDSTTYSTSNTSTVAVGRTAERSEGDTLTSTTESSSSTSTTLSNSVSGSQSFPNSTSTSSTASSSVLSDPPLRSIISTSSSALEPPQSESRESSAPPSTSTKSSFTSTSLLRTTVRPFPTHTPTISDPRPTSTSDPRPGTTTIVDVLFSTTDVQTSTFAPSSTSGALTARDNGFWDNKGAVAGTFTVVALVVIGAFVALFAFAKRRSKHRRNISDNFDFHEKFATQPSMVHYTLGRATSPNNGRLTAASPVPSVAELSSHRPMDPHLGSHDHSYFSSYYDTSYTSHGLRPVQEQGLVPRFPSSRPPVVQRPVVGRDSYQPSIDSFYGAT